MAERYLGRLTAPVSNRRKLLRVAAGLFLGTWWSTALCSGYRAVRQVYSVDVSAPQGPLRPGSTLHARIVTSGRTHTYLNVALVQGAHRELLVSRYVSGNREAQTDPRPRRDSVTIVLTPSVLARFHAGPARLRATGVGSSQFLHVPPPRLREIPVWIAESPSRIPL